MNKKRGLFSVVLVVILILVSTFVSAAVTTEVLVDGTDGCDRSLGDFLPFEQTYEKTDCNNEYTTAAKLGKGRGLNGCVLGFYESDSGLDADDDCGLTFVVYGEVMSTNFATLPLDQGGESFCKWEADENLLDDPPDEDAAGFQCGGISPENDDVAACFGQPLATGNSFSYICNADNLWHQCDSDAASAGESIKIGADFYYCVNNGGNYDWVPSTADFPDADHDSVPDLPNLDCVPNDFNVHGEYECVPKLDANGMQVVDPSTGQVVRSCIVEAKVICGDGKDNTCTVVPHEDDNCETNEVACNNQEFSWLNTIGDNKCCGNNGLADLGLTAVDRVSRVEHICLKNDFNLIGTAGDPSAWQGNKPSPVDAGSWFWASAESTDFEIVTIKIPTEKNYDVVSNGESWIACTVNTEGPLDGQNLPAGQRNIANQFYCYNEGVHWSFAQCVPSGEQNIDNSNKKRTVGDGLFVMRPNSDLGDSSITNIGSPFISIDLESSFDQYYGQGTRQDIAPYNQLEFSARFTDEVFSPANIQVTLQGLGQILFQQNILASAVNNPFIEAQEDGFYHFKIPLPGNLKSVETLEIEAVPERNNIIVRNIFFSQQSSSSMLCSGQTPGTQSNWIENADYFVAAGNLVNGKLVCAEIYGTNAWVGDTPGARCCGDVKNEYYIGSDYAANPDAYSCWNSKPVAAGDAFTTVEYEVEYTYAGQIINYPDVPFSYIDLLSSSQPSHNRVSYVQERKKLAEHIINKNDYSAEELETLFYTPVLLSTVQPVRVYYYDPARADDFNKERFFVKDLPSTITTIYTMVEFTKDYAVEVSTTIAEPSPREIMKYICTENQCLYPLPGSPPYKITNLHSGLYHLYFVDNTNSNGILVTQPNQEFLTEGNIMAKNIPLQVIFDNGLDNNGVYQGQPGFYGCEAADYVGLGLRGFINENHCSVKENKFCAYSTVGTINGWSAEPIISTLEIDPINEILVSEAHNFPPEERTNPTSILPGRNLLANSEFTENSGASVIGWEIMDIVSVGQQPLSEAGYIQQHQTLGILTLQTSDKVRSDPIAVEENMNLHFTQDATCDNIKGYLVDKNGNVEEILPGMPSFGLSGQGGGGTSNVNLNQQYLTGFNTGTAAYFYLEFTGSLLNSLISRQQARCDIKNPFLQRFDTQPVEYLLQGDQDKLRSGAACCPQGYCWNGYSCVAPMGEFTEISESVGENHYRCIDGSWQKQDYKYDWLGDQSGFCSAVSQCFVLSSQKGAIPGTTFDQAYNGNFPTCINSGEYVFDNFCEDGSWTSRTKVLAQELLTIVGTNDHTLYCGSYEDVLLNIQGVEHILSGDKLPFWATKNVCFDAVPFCADELSCSPRSRLISAEKNKCINNACVLVDDNGGIIFATTLNKNPNDQNSFLKIFGVPPQDLTQTCSGNFVNCNLGLSDGIIYYNSSLNAIIYSKQAISLQPGVVTRFLTFLQNLFRTQSLLTLSNVGLKNFQEIYSLQKGSKRVLAVKGVFNEEPALIALYENFDTPICDYLALSKINHPELNIPLQAQPLSCVVTSEGFKQVNATKAVDFLWPELTGKLRALE